MSEDTKPFEPVTTTCMKCAPQMYDLKDRINDRVEQLALLQGRYNRLARAAIEAGINVMEVTAAPDVEIGPRIEMNND